MSVTINKSATEDDAPQSVELWERELKNAGWSRHKGRRTVWQAPSGTLWLGPYGAWKAMRVGAK